MKITVNGKELELDCQTAFEVRRTNWQSNRHCHFEWLSN